MITQERPKVVPGGGGRKPPPRRPGGDGWWRNWPGPPNRPRPVTLRSFLFGSAIAVPALILVDGLLGTMAWYATGSVLAGVAVFAVMLVLTSLELGLVAWAARSKQEQERRRTREQ